MAAAAAAAASRVCLPRRHSITCALPSGAAAASVSAWQARTRSAPAAARRHSGQARVAAAAAAGTGADGARSPEAKEEMSGCVLMCSELFSKEYLFVMPAIQRPYDWDESDAQLLLEDLLSALGPQMTNVRALEPFLLGPINLADGPVVDESDLRLKYVLDGQQRIITLCLLFAAARARFLESDDQADLEFAKEIEAMLKMPASRSRGHPAVLRVQMLRRDDTLFLESLMLAPDFEPTELVGESQPKMWANLQLYHRRLGEHDLPRIEALLQFILQRVMLTVTLSSSVGTALKYFSVSAQRGKQLGPIDVLKGFMFDSAAMDEQLQDTYGQRWGNLERLEGVGREGISRVCSLLAAIHLRQERGRRSEFDEPQLLFRELAGEYGSRAGPAFFDGVLEPYTQLYLEMMSEEWRLRNGSEDQRKEASYLLTCLCRLSPKLDDWEPLALATLMQQRLGRMDAAALIALLQELERLSWFWMLCKVPKAVRRKRIAQALEELGLGGQWQQHAQQQHAQQQYAASTAAVLGVGDEAQRLVPAITACAAPALRITEEEKAAMLAALDGPVYALLRGKPVIALLARLNEHLNRSMPHMKPYTLQNSKLTVEHVLPQKPPAGSDWQRQFTREQQEHWLHRLGNLILLPGRLNSAASNKSFAGKRDAWQTMLEGRTVGMPLTDKVCQREQWDAEAAAEAQGEAVRLAFAVWRLHDVGATSATQH